MTFTIFLFAWKLFYTLPPIQFHLLVMDTENSLWGKKHTASREKEKKKDKLSDIRRVKQLKNTFSLHPHPWATDRRLMAKLLLPSQKLVCGSPKLQSRDSPGSWGSWIQAFTSTELGSGETGPATPSSGSSTLVTVKCGIVLTDPCSFCYCWV